MYQQIWANPEQRNFQYIYSGKTTLKEDAKLFQLITMTYETAAAPFLATRVLKQLAQDKKYRFPLDADSVLSDPDVGEILAGANDVDNLLMLQEQLIEIIESGGMELHIWFSNVKFFRSCFI